MKTRKFKITIVAEVTEEYWKKHDMDKKHKDADNGTASKLMLESDEGIIASKITFDERSR